MDDYANDGILRSEDEVSLEENIGALSEKLADSQWLARISRAESFHRYELKRIEFLATLLSFLKTDSRKKDDEEAIFEGIDLEETTNEVSRVLGKFLHEEPDESLGAALFLRNAFQKIEVNLEQVRKRLKILTESHLSVGNAILNTRNTIALALGGGGIWGLSHTSILEEFRRNGIPIHMIGGAGMGAVIGGFAADAIDPKTYTIRDDRLIHLYTILDELKSMDQFTDERKIGGKILRLLPIDTMINLGDPKSGRYAELTDRKPNVQFFAQTIERDTTQKKTVRRFLGADPRDRMEKILGVGSGIAMASAALGPEFGFSPIELDGKIYSRDTSIAKRSITHMVKHLRSEDATTVIGAPIGFMDSDAWSWARWLQDYVSVELADRGDIVIEPQTGRGIISGRFSRKGVLTNFAKNGQPFARTKDELPDQNPNSRRIAIPTTDFLNAGEEAIRKKMTQLFGHLGLQRLPDRFRN